MPPKEKNRVKVYHLNADGAWEDQGTGHATISQKCIYCHAEGDGAQAQVILEAPVSLEDIYQRQGDTIISWNDPVIGMDLALSFQESECCELVWAELCSAQGREAPGVDSPASVGGEFGTAGEEGDGASSGGLELPCLAQLDMNHLGDIAKVLENSTMFQRDAIAQHLGNEGYIKRLVDLFSMCEDLENTEGLHHLFKVFKGAIMLSDNCLLEQLLSEEYMLDVIGCLEHDPELQESQKHREFLTQTAVFKEVVPIRDERVLARIHQNFRVAYLTDVVLAKYLDDHTFASLKSLIFFNNVEIVNRLQGDASFLDELFRRIFAKDVAADTLRDLLGFVQELCGLAKNLQIINRNQFYKKLMERDLFGVIDKFLPYSDLPVRLSVVDILNGVLTHEPAVCRSYMMSQDPQGGLFGRLIDQLFADNDAGMKMQVSEVLRDLLSPEGIEGGGQGNSDHAEFLGVFYENYMERMVACITDVNAVKEKMQTYKAQRATQTDSDETLIMQVRFQVCEILAFCVQHHGYRIKYFILRHNIVQKALKLIGGRCHQANSLTMAIIRFVRACVGLKDEFYNRHMVKNNLFEPLIAIFMQNGSKYNLLNSVIVELVDFVRKENVKTIVDHLAQSYRDDFERVQYVPTFKELILRYEQNQELQERPSGQQQQDQERAAPRRRMAESDDESYFNESDDDEEGPQQAPSSSSNDQAGMVKLVAYGDDDDEESSDSPTPNAQESRMKRQKVEADHTTPGEGAPPAVPDAS